MNTIVTTPRWKIVLNTWPKPGAVLILASFALTFWLLVLGFLAGPEAQPTSWLEPLTAILGGLGAFIFAVVLICRRVDTSKAQADRYHLAQGLATGYYFSFVRPLVGALRDPSHAVHAQVAASGGHRITGLIVALPRSVEDCDPSRHEELLKVLTTNPNHGFDLSEIKVSVARRPRPIFAKLAVSKTTKSAILLDIPTTLVVIPEFAEFVVQREPDGAALDDEFVADARKELVVSSETVQFVERLEEFVHGIHKLGGMEPRPTAPTTLLHIVSLANLRRRMDEVAGVDYP